MNITGYESFQGTKQKVMSVFDESDRIYALRDEIFVDRRGYVLTTYGVTSIDT